MTLCCGLGFDAKGRLVAARTDPAQILVLQPERKILLEAFGSLPLLRPNDLTIAKNGGIYFSDQPRQPAQPQVPGRKKGILHLAPNGSVIQVDDRLEAPNGLVLSPDERVLYAADSFGDTLIAFDVGKDGALTNRRPFGHLDGATQRAASGVLRSADGLAVDAQGRVYAATRIGRSPATLWTLTNGEKLASCEIAFVPIGVKATVMRNGKLLYTRIFADGDEATAWAEEERKGHLAKGWSHPLGGQPTIRR
jgi:sugar lactone lactonase YvrE